jgi:hypothetical protein
VFEYWGSGKPQQYFTIRPGPGAGRTGTVSGGVRDPYGSGVTSVIVTLAGAGSTLSEAGGAYSVTAPVGTYEGMANKAYYTGQNVPGIQVHEDQTTVVDFVITGQPPEPAASLNVVEGNTLNTVHWQDSPSGNSTGTMIRYSTVGPPATADAGALLLDQSAAPGSEHQYEHANLTNGVRIYYSAFAYFSDASRHYADRIDASGSPAVQADYDHDGDVDQEDYSHFQVCLSGSFNPQDDPDCQDAKFDLDDDVDEDDLDVFLACIQGHGVYADPQCASLP